MRVPCTTPEFDEFVSRAAHGAYHDHDAVAGSLRLSQETARAGGQRYGNQLLMDSELETVDETIAAIRSITADDVQQVAKRIIGPGEFALAVVGPSASADRLDSILTA